MLSMDDLLPVRELFPGYVHHWIYTENNRPVMIVARYEDGGEKTYRQFRVEGGELVLGMPVEPYPLYGLDSLRNQSSLNAVCITEGEKSAAVSHQLKWPCVSPSLGAQNTSKSDWQPLRHFSNFIILRDNDKSGIEFVRSVARELYRIRPDATIFVVNLTPNIPGGDIVDWLQSTVLRGQGWYGYEPISEITISSVIAAIESEIRQLMIAVEDCPLVKFQPIEARFEGKPLQLDVKLSAVPPFPITALPDPIGEYVEIVSSQFSQVPDFAATTLLSALGGLVGRSIHLKMRFDWYETANCWGILVGPPSSKKSPIMRKIFSLFKKLEDQAATDFVETQKQYRMEKKQAEDKKEEFYDPPPTRRRYITDDVTTPKLRELMAANPKGIILRNDELKGQLERLDKQGNEGDRSFMMSCWSGLEVYNEDRMCRDSLINTPLALTWIGCIPPTALQKYLREAMGHGGGADGFMQRFQFVCYPDHKKRYDLPTDNRSPELNEKVQAIFTALDSSMGDNPRVIFFEDDAQAAFDDWLVNHENDTRLGVHPIYWESHLGKQAKPLAVLIIILHRLTEVQSGIDREKVQLETLERALKLLDYFQAHAKRCYNSIIGAVVDDAKAIIGLLKEKRLSFKFKAQEIYHNGLGGLSDSARVKAALELLQENGWLVSEKGGSSTGRKHEYWILNPRAFDKENDISPA